MKAFVRVQLSGMMFLQFFIWGAWFVTLGTYLGKGLSFDAVAIGRAYGTMPIGAIVAPFFVGMIADRFFPAQVVLGACHLLGAAVLFWASALRTPGEIYWALLAYALCYNPTLALVNAIAFNQMESPARQFPAVRVFGTIGWIVAGNLVGLWGVEATAAPMRLAAGVSAVFGVLAFFLPHTPPKALGHKVTAGDVLGVQAFRLLKDRSFAVFVACSLLVCIPLAFYYNFTNLFLNDKGIANAAGKMTLGQISEVAFMLVMPFFFARLGVKWMLVTGMLAWAGRYMLFAFGAPDTAVWMYYMGILLHGICYDFFFVTGQIYVDRTAPKAIQAGAQGFITLVTYGVGMWIGAEISGHVVNHFTGADGVKDWRPIWLAPAAMAGVVLVLFAVLFREPKAGAGGAARAEGA